MTQAQDISEMLHSEHLHTLAIVDAIEGRIFADRARPLNAADAGDVRFIDELIEAIDADIFRHFQFEEEVLFPRVNAAGLEEVTAMLIEEHETIRTMADELRSLAKSARAGGLDPERWADFRNTAMDFIHAAMFHIQKEEMGVIRPLAVTIGADASRQLAAEYAAFRAATPDRP